MRLYTFSKRNAKEILRDPLSLIFGLGFPIILILLLTAIQKNIPAKIFKLDSLIPAMTVFGLSFIALFSAVLVSRDRESAFFQRLCATPMTARDFILGYILPLLPISLLQSTVCYLLGIILGLKLKFSVLLAIILNLPASLFFISLGILFGTILTSKQVGGICGALLTNLTAWLSGIWFDPNLVGGIFKSATDILPFYHFAELERAAYCCHFNDVLPHLLIAICYTAVITALSVVIFLRKMHKM